MTARMSETPKPGPPSMDTNGLPDFEDPPVNETVYSLQFAPLPAFSIPHFGLYWSRIRAEYGFFNVQPPVPATTEQFTSTPLQGLPKFEFVMQPDVRCWFLNSSGTQLVQVQRDRFTFNWRQVEGSEKYPRYRVLREAFVAQWHAFTRFLSDESLGSPEVNQCEVSYINVVPYGKGWSGFGELDKVIAPWSGQSSGDFLPPPERVRIELNYNLPDKLGRLHVQALPVVRARDMTELLQITLTARGAPRSSSDDDVLAWIDLGREWVVKGFADFTTNDMHRLWGRKR